mgnify:CR=1 FL=1
MKTGIKGIKQLERDITQNFSGNLPIIVLDTCALIDIRQSIKQYNLINKNGNRSPKYERTTLFLKSLRSQIVITPKTYQEIQDHGRMRLNSHTLELSPNVVDFALDTMINSNRFISGLESEMEFDRARYDAYWASQEACNGIHKKHLEGCSETDREILSTIAYLSRCRIPDGRGKLIRSVLVISPDAHILKGAEFLKRGFDGRYSAIVPISTRH